MNQRCSKKKILKRELSSSDNENSDDFLSTKMEYFLDGMNIETKRHQSIFLEKTEEDITILSENLGEVNPYLLAIWLVKMYGMVMESAS